MIFIFVIFHAGSDKTRAKYQDQLTAYTDKVSAAFSLAESIVNSKKSNLNLN